MYEGTVLEALQRLYLERSDLKPHQDTANKAFRHSAEADDLSDKYDYGKIPKTDAHKVWDAHQRASEHHMSAARALQKAGHHGTAGHHTLLAGKHAAKAQQYLRHHAEHGAGEKEKEPEHAEAAESVQPRAMTAEMRRLLGWDDTFVPVSTARPESLQEMRLLSGVDYSFPTRKQVEEAVACCDACAKGQKCGSEVAEKAPPGFEGTVKAMKRHPSIKNPYAMAWAMKGKGYKSHIKEFNLAEPEEPAEKPKKGKMLLGKKR